MSSSNFSYSSGEDFHYGAPPAHLAYAHAASVHQAEDDQPVREQLYEMFGTRPIRQEGVLNASALNSAVSSALSEYSQLRPVFCPITNRIWMFHEPILPLTDLLGEKRYREELPFERFVYDYKRDEPVWIQRAISVGHILEGALRLLAHGVAALATNLLERFTSIRYRITVHRHMEVCRELWKGLQGSAHAVWDPEEAVQRDGIGLSPFVFLTWGTEYHGTRTFYIVGNYDNQLLAPQRMIRA